MKRDAKEPAGPSSPFLSDWTIPNHSDIYDFPGGFAMGSIESSWSVTNI
jgi:hypothetical protein